MPKKSITLPLTVEVELCTEDRARLDALIAALSHDAPMEALQAPVAQQDPPDEPAAPDVPIEPEPAPEAPQEAAPVTTAAVQRKVVALSAMGKKAEVRAIVKSHAAKVSDIPEDELPEVWAQLCALEG